MAQGMGYLDAKPLEDWTPSEVDNSLSSIGEAFTQYRKVFLDNGVSGNVLLQLDVQDCIELGITKGIHRKAILSFIQELRLKHIGSGQNGRRVSNASMSSLASSQASLASHHGAYAAAAAPLPPPYCSNPFEPGASPVPPGGHHPIPPQSPMTPTPQHHRQHIQHTSPSPLPSHHLHYAQGAGYHAAQTAQHVSQSPGVGEVKEMYTNPFAQPQAIQVQKPSFGDESAVGNYIAQQRGVPAQPKYFDGPDSPGFLCPPIYHTHTPSIISSASSTSERSERSLSSESSAFRSLSGDTTCMSPPPPPPRVGYSLGDSCLPPPPPPYDLSVGDDTPMIRPGRLDLHRGGECNDHEELEHADDKLMGDIDDFLVTVERRRVHGRPKNDSSVLVDLPRVHEGRRRSISKLATPTKTCYRRSQSHGPRRRTVSSPGPRRRAMSVGPGGRNKNEDTEKSSPSYPQRSHFRAGRSVSLEEGYGTRRRCSEESAVSTGTSSWDGGSTSSELTESSDDESNDDDSFTEPRYVQRIISGADLESDDDSSDSGGVGWLIEKVPRWVLKGK